MNTSPSCLYGVLRICAEQPDMDKLLSSFFHFLFLHFAPVFQQEDCRVSCMCSKCVGKPRVLALSRLQHTDVTEYLKAWNHVIRLLPISSQPRVIPRVLLLITDCVIQMSIPPSLFVVELLQSCFSWSGKNCVLDVVEHSWNTSQSPSVYALLSCLLAHTPSLHHAEVLSILNELWKEGGPTPSLLLLTLHVLWVRLSQSSLPSDPPELLSLVQTLNSVDVDTWSELPFLLVHDVGTLLAHVCPSLSLCCSRWRLHVCPSCLQRVAEVGADTQCVMCMTPPSALIGSFVLHRECNVKRSACGWRAGEPHCCGACERECAVACESICDSTTPSTTPSTMPSTMPSTNHSTQLQACYCATGRFVLSYDYSISDDSSDSSDAFEAKRLCVELKDIEQAIRDREQLMRGLNRDVWRCVADYCAPTDLTQLACVDSAMKSVCEEGWVWRKFYLRLFRAFRCAHNRRFEHDYRLLTRRRVRSMKKLKEGEVICQYCGCAKRFEGAAAYRQHVQSRHSCFCL